MRWLLILFCSLSALACQSSTTVRRAKKEVFVEPPGEGDSPLTLWPFAPEDEERAFEVIRSLREGRTEGRRKLAILIDQWKPPAKRRDGTVAPISTVVVIDDSEHPNGLPDVLYFPGREDARVESGVYVGHSVYKRDDWNPSSDLSHHLRFLVVNREPFGLRLPVSSIQLGVKASDEEEGTLGGGFTLLAAANERGEAIRSLYVEPGGSAVIHVFYRARRIGRSLHLRWLVEEGQAPVGKGLGVSDEAEADGSEGELEPDPDDPEAGEGEAGEGGPDDPGAAPGEGAEPAPDLPLQPEPERSADGRGGLLPPEPLPGQLGPAGESRAAGPPEEEDERRWKFYAVLKRRYVIEEGIVTSLEQRVADEEPLPEPADGDYTEPRVTPLAPR